MARHLLDTTALIDYSKKREPAYSRIVALIAAEEDLGVCAVNVAEFYAGLRPEQRDQWAPLFSVLHYWEITRAAAQRAGVYRYTFARRGRAISTADALVVAVAVEVGATLITSNVKDFPMDDVQIFPLLEDGR